MEAISHPTSLSTADRLTQEFNFEPDLARAISDRNNGDYQECLVDLDLRIKSETFFSGIQELEDQSPEFKKELSKLIINTLKALGPAKIIGMVGSSIKQLLFSHAPSNLADLLKQIYAELDDTNNFTEQLQALVEKYSIQDSEKVSRLSDLIKSRLQNTASTEDYALAAA